MNNAARINKKDLELLFATAVKGLPDFYRVFLSDDEIVPSPKFHYLISDLLLKARDNVAIEAFRESGKSSLVLRAFPLYCLTFPSYKRSYIVIIKANDDLAKDKLKDIIDEHTNHPILKHNIKKIHQKGERYEVTTTEGVRIRIEAYGKGVNIRGLLWKNKRPDVIIIDDPQTTDDMYSDSTVDKDWKWFLSDINMMGKKTRFFIIGNNLGDRCMIERIGKNAEELGFKFLRIPAIENGKATWEVKFSLDKLKKEKENYAKLNQLDIWLRERMCIAASEESRIFKKEWLRYYTTLPEGRYNYYLGVDLSLGKEKKSDYTAICILAVNQDNIRFIEDIQYGRWGVYETIDKIFDLVLRYNPVHVAIEQSGFQAVMEDVIQKEMLKRNAFFRIVMMTHLSKAKEVRIRSLEPLYANGFIYHKAGMHYLAELETELAMVTATEGIKSEYDDLLDALEIANRGAKPPLRRRSGQLQRKAVGVN